MAQVVSSTLLLIVVLFLISGGIRTLIHMHKDEDKDAMELALTSFVLLGLSLYGFTLAYTLMTIIIPQITERL